MARFGKINQKQFDNTTPGTDGQFLRRQSGVWVPYTLQPSDIPAQVRSPLLVAASRAMVATDAGKHLYNTSSTPYDLTLSQAVFAAGDEIEIAADGSGVINILPQAGFTINGSVQGVSCLSGTAGFLKFRSGSAAQWYGGTASAIKDWTIYSSAAALSLQAAGVQNICSFTIPANTVKPDGFLNYEILYTGTGTGAKALSISLGGVTLVTSSMSAANSVFLGKNIFNRANNTVVTANVATTGYTSSSTVLPIATALNWTVNQTFLATINVTTAAQGITMSYMYVRVINP
jgi:hypothetical protein